jgi:hypothetical protein
MNSSRCRLLILALAISMALRAWVSASPATQPAGSITDRSNIRSGDASTATSASAWPATLAAFANALVDSSSDSALEPFLADAPIIRRFNRPQQESIGSLRDGALHTTIIASRAYSKTPDTLATDLAADFKKADLPECVKRRLTPGDDKDARRGNATAARWVAESLSTSSEEPVGVIVLWRPLTDDEQSSADDHADDRSHLTTKRLPLFVLVRGEQTDGRYRIRQICFGDPLPITGD